ncbi:ExeM/NucH family extracellular endonuclease [Leucobacter komagatae]|uniref:ExeM/NucH family extracellular endonuclease n=1 Tax=Leucobacter komagatae TaxID=55969 RepID=UPI000698C35C|nr:ExeM/NucH family extracellular endonuclease [Leucobacter komagatae]
MKSDPGKRTGESFFRRSTRAKTVAVTALVALGLGAAGTGPAIATPDSSAAVVIEGNAGGSGATAGEQQLGADVDGANVDGSGADGAEPGAAPQTDLGAAQETEPGSDAEPGSGATQSPEGDAADAAGQRAAAQQAGQRSIAEVQGTTDVSPFVGQTVQVEGVITADHRTGGYAGIVIQTPGSGGESAEPRTASDGIFVHLAGKNVPGEIGDLVSVTGVVSEYFGQTQIAPAQVGDVELVEQEVGLPKATPLPDSIVGADREPYENMLVAPTGDYFVASSHQLHNFGALWLSPGAPQVKNTELARPGAEATKIAQANRESRILLDDGYSIQVSNAAHPGDQPYFTADTVVRTGDTVNFTDRSFVLQYGFDEWRLQPVRPLDSTAPSSERVTFNEKNSRQAAPKVAGDATVAAFNVYNYFTTLKNDNKDARGAVDAQQFATQKSKIVSAINQLDADIVGLMEVENSVKFGAPVDSALADLVDGLNADAGSAVWAYVPTPKVLHDPAKTDFITNAIIYKKDEVTPKKESATIIDEAVWGNAREPIAQAFDIGGRTVTVVANHFKSKSGSGAEPADGQGHFNADRVAQAKSLLQFTQTLEERSGSTDMLLVGDFNAYSQEDPIFEFTSRGWVDTAAAHAAGQYSYGFNGELGSLDHVIASPSLAGSVAGAAIWGANAAEWGDRGYAFRAAEPGTPFRASDHDPIIVGVTAESQPVSIDVATINDFHGRIEADGKAAGAAVIAGAVAEFRKSNPNLIFAGAGDLIGASTFTSFIQKDEPTIDALNLAGLDVSAAGNHEFDEGWEDLRDRVQDRADWEYISSNVFLTETGEPALAPSWVREVDGVRVGFVGAVTEDLDSLVSPEGIKDLEVRSVAESVNTAAAALKDGDPKNGEADVIILLVHEGASTTEVASITPASQLGKIVYGVGDDVDAIVSAHTHLAYNHVIDGRPVVSAGQYGENLGLMNLQVDRETKQLLSIKNEIKPLVVDGKPRYPADTEVQAVVDAAKAEADVLGGVSVGAITGDFNRALQSDGKTENRGGESTIGNFVADVHMWSTGADIALMNPGGIRANLTYASSGEGDPNGNVTYREAATVQPFANPLVTVSLTGAQVKRVLEEQWQPEGSARPFLKLGLSEGLSYHYDPKAARGSHITAITLNGKPLDLEASYTVAANGFLAGGGDNFLTFRDGTDRKDSGRSDLQSMVEWFAINKEATPDVAKRAVGVQLSAPPAAGASADTAARAAVAKSGSEYAEGDEVTIELSSLAFSAGERAPETVAAMIGDTSVASAPVDPAVVDAWDEAGRATLTFKIPAGLSGVTHIEIVTSDGFTRTSLPITVADGSGETPETGEPGTENPETGGPGTETPETGGPGTGTGPGSGLGDSGHQGGIAETGAEIAWLAAATIALLALGAGLLLVARRREAQPAE